MQGKRRSSEFYTSDETSYESQNITALYIMLRSFEINPFKFTTLSKRF